MSDEHIEIMHAWMDQYDDVGLSFDEVDESSAWVNVTFRSLKYPPYKMKLNLTNPYGHVESSGDFEINRGGLTCYGTMWDEDISERSHSKMPFSDWVDYYLARMAKLIRNDDDSLIFVGGIHNR